MFLTIRELVSKLHEDFLGNIFSIKFIPEENKAIIIMNNKEIVATLGSKDKRILNELFGDDIYNQIRTNIKNNT